MEQSTQETAVIRIAPSMDEAVIALHYEALRLRDYATKLIITSDDDLVPATNDLSILAKIKKAIEEKRKEYVNPLNNHIKEINTTFKLLSDPLDEADKTTRYKILHYRSEQERKHKEAEELNRLKAELATREAALAEEKGEPPPPVQELIEVIPPPPSRVHADLGQAGIMRIRKWEVKDFSQVPDDYKMLDSARITKVVKAGIPSIPGIKIWGEETLRVDAR